MWRPPLYFNFSKDAPSLLAGVLVALKKKSTALAHNSPLWTDVVRQKKDIVSPVLEGQRSRESAL